MKYQYALGAVGALDDIAAKVAASAMTNKAIGVMNCTNGSVEVEFEQELSGADQDILANIVAEIPLHWAKEVKKKAIDANTDVIIARGMTLNGVVLSLSLPAQITWIGLYQAKDVLTYPMPVSTKDGGSYSLADAAAVTQLFLTGLGIINGAIASGRALKVAVNAANSVAEVEAITDNR